MAKRTLQHSPFLRVVNETQQGHELRRGLIRKLQAHFGGTVITFFASFTRDAVIQDGDAEMIESILASEHESGKQVTLIINAPGGIANAAERIASICRAYSAGNKFEVVVPHMAKSAATMICFGASKIHMSPTAELGPVDPQVQYGDKEHPKWISAEEYVRSYDELMAQACGGKCARIEGLLQQLQRYDARYIEQLKSHQKLAEDISVRLLKTGMMSGLKEAEIKGKIEAFLSQKKTNSHGRMIGLNEAKGCGLEVKTIDLQTELWHTVWELYVRANWSVSRHSAKVIETAESAVRS